MSNVRVVARNADGSGCVVLYTMTKPPENTMTDEEYFEAVAGKAQERDPELKDKEYVDTDSASLPPLNQQSSWRLVDGEITNAP